MRKLILILLLSSHICGFSQNAISLPPETMKNVFSSIYDHIKLCFPDDGIKVSCEIDDSGMLEFLLEQFYGKLRTKPEHEEFVRQNISNTLPVDSLCELFASSNRTITDPEYELWFSYPEHDLFVCTLYPYGERESASGPVTVFMFRVTPQGIIRFMSRTTVYRNDPAKNLSISFSP